MSRDELILLGTTAFIIIAAVAATAAAYLWLKNGLKLRRNVQEPLWIGSAFDAKSVTPRIERVRQNYLEALHGGPHPGFHAKGLLATARESVTRFAYFQGRHEEEPEANQTVTESQLPNH